MVEGRRFRRGIRVSWLLALAGWISAAGLAGATEDLPPRREPWTVSRVSGTPGPPSIYRTGRVLPRLQFREPVELIPEPGSDRLVLGELGGRIWTFPNSGDPESATLFADLRSVRPGFGSLYGMAFHPRYPEVPAVFLCYVLAGEDPDGSRVSRFAVRTGGRPELDPESEEIVLTFLAGGHNGGCLRFGPDGCLYISTGDGKGPNPPDTLRTGQDVGDLLSSVLRIDVERREGGRAYAVPPDNPFAGVPGARPEVWAYGFRNPWKMSFDPQGGGLWVGDVGWDLWELVHLAERGGNYGWAAMEGSQPVLADVSRGPSPVTPPVAQHPHSEATSITGGFVYRGSRLPELHGAYVYGDYGSGKIWGLRVRGGEVTWQEELADTPMQIITFGEDQEGELYVVDYAGTIHRLEPNPARESSAFPQTLGATGLFAGVAEGRPAPGVHRYEVRAERWADGARSERFLGVPGQGRLRADGDPWGFPEGSVLAKTYLREGPEGPRRLETQVLHFEGGQWHASSYRWRADQSDADLAPAEGLATEEWAFASRAECLRCHNVHKPVLAFSTPQLDRESGGEPQLVRWSREGLLDREISDIPPDRFPDPSGSEGTLDERARAYLAVNCAHCHMPNGGGMVPMRWEYHLPLAETAALDAAPQQGDLGLKDARVLAPGAPGSSMAYYRMAKLGHGRMPRIGSREVDWQGLDLLRRWILSLGDANGPAGEAGPGGLVTTDEWLQHPAKALTVQWMASELPPEAPLRRRWVETALAEGRAEVKDLFLPFLPLAERAAWEAREPGPQEVLALRGDADRGARFLREGRGAICLSCHRCGETGRALGPDFGETAARLSAEQMLESILHPSAAIAEGYAAYLLRTRDGQSRTGFVLAREAGKVRFRDETGDTDWAEADVMELAPQPQSLMPEGLLLGVGAQEVADLIAYLHSLAR